MRRGLLGGVLLCSLCCLPADAREGVFEPDWLRPSPDAWVVRSTVDADVRFEVPVGRIARSGGLVRPRSVRRLEGRLASITWAWPRGSTSRAVHAALREQLPGTPWFECAGRACGSASYWAHRVFGVPDLYGRDELQYYLALPGRDGSAVLLYVAERGTREVFAHLVELTPAQGGDQRLVADAVLAPGEVAAGGGALPEAL